MRKFLILFIFIAFIGGPLFAEEDADIPFITLNILFKDSLAFMGIGMEVIFGNIGIGGTFTTFFMGSSQADTTLFLYEPGVYIHLYLGDPDSAMYLLGDISFFGIGVTSGGETTTSENTGILNLNAGIGFNAYFGSKNNIHFSIEIGARYPYFVLEGEVDDSFFIIIPHFQLQFGMGLFS